MTEHWTFKWAGWHDDSPRHYTYDTETGVITNVGNGRSVQADKGLDFRAWLMKAGAIQIEQKDNDPTRKGGGLIKKTTKTTKDNIKTNEL